MLTNNWYPAFVAQGDAYALKNASTTMTTGEKPRGEINDLLAGVINEDGEVRMLVSA